jgi:AAHS family 4-hydroxybenzoate transporter-like MFS transporter
MAVTGTVDISEVIDSQRWGGFLGRFIALMFLMGLFDGYDLSCMAFASPSLIREWHVDKGVFGAVFAAATFGGIVGGIVFGYISDYWGRKYSAITAMIIFGILSLTTVYVTNIQELLVLRFLAGFGIGALLPLIFTISVEFAPQRFRATVAMAAVIAVGIGIMLAGVIGASLVPTYGWQIVFWIAGIGPLAIAALAFFALPESPRFLLSRKRPAHQIAEVLRRINPHFAFPADAEFTDRNKIVKVVVAPTKYPALMLFRGRLAAVTTLLWVTYFFCTITPSIIITWVPILGENLGIAPSFAALSVSIGGIGLVVASLLLMPLLERFGFVVVWPWPLIAVPAFAVLGLTHVSNSEFVALFVLIGFAGGGTQAGMHASVGQFYPDECRGTGVSWAVCISRFGAVAGPAVAGALLSKGTSVHALFVLMCIPILIFSVCAFALGTLNGRLQRESVASETLRMTEELAGAAEF